jgi:GT2 family glycosyltransferase
LRRLLRREPGPAERFARFQTQVEPELAAVPRVHRFAQVPVVGDAGTETVAVGGLEDADAPWVILADAALAPLARERFGQAAALAPDALVITCDEDVIDAAGRRSDPRVYPGPSPDTQRSGRAPLAALCVRRDAALEALREIPDGPARPWELLMRLAGPDGAGHAHVPVILAHRSAPPPPAAWTAPERAVRGEPLVDVVVLFKDKPDLLARCVDGVLNRTSWERLRLRLVDNGSTDAALDPLLARLAADPRVEIRRDDRPFNFAALNNAAVAGTDADALVFLNNDTDVLDGDWVQGLLAEAQRPEVGAVAPLLTYPDGTVQHAGAALGLHGYAGHPFAGLAPDAPTPFGTATDGTRNWLAVTAACMMVERAKFETVGGFDEGFVVGGNDVDLCLRLTAGGHRSLAVPHVELLHDESRSRGVYVDPGDFAASEASYGAFRTVGDPFYNPSLTLTDTTCSLRLPDAAR